MFNNDETEIVRAIELIEQANHIQQDLLHENTAFDVYMLLQTAIARLEQCLDELEGEAAVSEEKTAHG